MSGMHTRAGGYPVHQQQQAYGYTQTARAPVQVQQAGQATAVPNATAAQLPSGLVQASAARPASAAPVHPVEAGIAKRKKIKSTTRMSYATKLEILQRLKEEPGFTQAVAARTYKVTDAAISHLKKTFVNDEHIAQLRAMAVANPKGKAIGKGRYDEIDRGLRDWLSGLNENQRANLSAADVKQKAKQLADTILGPGHDFKASSGWYDNWKKRKNIFDLTLDPPADLFRNLGINTPMPGPPQLTAPPEASEMMVSATAIHEARQIIARMSAEQFPMQRRDEMVQQLDTIQRTVQDIAAYMRKQKRAAKQAAQQQQL